MNAIVLDKWWYAIQWWLHGSSRRSHLDFRWFCSWICCYHCSRLDHDCQFQQRLLVFDNNCFFSGISLEHWIFFLLYFSKQQLAGNQHLTAECFHFLGFNRFQIWSFRRIILEIKHGVWFDCLASDTIYWKIASSSENGR